MGTVLQKKFPFPAFTKIKNGDDIMINEEMLKKEFDTIVYSIISYYLKQSKNNKENNLKRFINNIEKEMIYTILENTNGSQKMTAEFLGIRNTTLNEKLKKYGFNKSNKSLSMINLFKYRLETKHKIRNS